MFSLSLLMKVSLKKELNNFMFLERMELNALSYSNDQKVRLVHDFCDAVIWTMCPYFLYIAILRTEVLRN